MRLSLFLIACAALSSNVLRATSTPIYSNYNNSVPGGDPGGYSLGALSITYADGVRFTVNATPDPGFILSLSDIEFVGSVSNVADIVTASLYSSVSAPQGNFLTTMPGSLLMTFPAFTLSTNPAEYHLTPSTPFTLTTGQEYWFVLSDPAQGDLFWNEAAGADFGIATQSDPEADWTTGAYPLGSLIVNATEVPAAVPEPGTLFGLGGGLILLGLKRLRK